MHPGCGQDWTFISSLTASLELLQQIDSPALKLVLDACHLGHDPEFLATIPDIVHQIALVQLGDARRTPNREPDRAPLGQGNLPLRDLIRCLTEQGYEGFYEIELVGQEFEGRDYNDILMESKQAVSDLCDGLQIAP